MEMSIRYKKRAGTRENILGQLEDYSKGADSEQMFSGLQISREADFKKHLNKYDVIRVTLEHNCIIKNTKYKDCRRFRACGIFQFVQKTQKIYWKKSGKRV